MYVRVYECVCMYVSVCMDMCVCVCLCNKGPRNFVCQAIFTTSWQQHLMKHIVYSSENQKIDHCLTAFITFHET